MVLYLKGETSLEDNGITSLQKARSMIEKGSCSPRHYMFACSLAPLF